MKKFENKVNQIISQARVRKPSKGTLIYSNIGTLEFIKAFPWDTFTADNLISDCQTAAENSGLEAAAYDLINSNPDKDPAFLDQNIILFKFIREYPSQDYGIQVKHLIIKMFMQQKPVSINFRMSFSNDSVQKQYFEAYNKFFSAMQKLGYRIKN